MKKKTQNQQEKQLKKTGTICNKGTKHTLVFIYKVR